MEKIKDQIKLAIDVSISESPLKSLGNDEEVSDKNIVIVRGNSVKEPQFMFKRNSGSDIFILPGNLNEMETQEYLVANGGRLHPDTPFMNFNFDSYFRENDEIDKPEEEEARKGGKKGSPDGVGEDDFMFYLSPEEWTKYLFENLELPNQIDKAHDKVEKYVILRSGYTINGAPANLSIKRTMRNAIARRMALSRPKDEEILVAEEKLKNPDLAVDDKLSLQKNLEYLRSRMMSIPYIDPFDVRYNNFVKVEQPNFKAVMFCLMDVSGSMSENQKEIAKRFYVLLYRFLKMKYKYVDVVFIRHTTEASVVDEQTFFYSQETGGTIVSSGLQEIIKLIKTKYQSDTWNIYVAQATDGDNYDDDNQKVVTLLTTKILPHTQYYIYIEIPSRHRRDYNSGENIPTASNSDLWDLYDKIHQTHKNLEIKIIHENSEIYPIFRKIFEKKPST